MSSQVSATPSPASILVVEHIAADLQSVSEALAPLGYPLVHATSGHETRDQLFRERWGCVLADVQAPGLEVVESLVQRVPLLLLTPTPREEALLLRGCACGAVEYLLKPVDPDVLRTRVKALLERLEGERTAPVLEVPDDTEQVRARQRTEALAANLQCSEERFRAFAEATSIVLWSADATGNVVEDSPSWRAFTGQSYEEWRGYGWLDAIHPEDQPKAYEAWRRAYESRGFYEVEYRLRRKTGGYSDVLARGVPLFKPDGSVREWVGTVSDITERKRDAEERERILRELAEAVRTRDEFLSVASHELKTPLTPLSLKLQVLARTAEARAIPAERLPKDIEVMRRQVKRLADLVNDLLDVSRISTGRLQLQLDEVDLSTVVREVVAQFEPQAVKAGCLLELRAGQSVVGRWDRLRVEQVVVNLLSNAIKYGAGKPVYVRVEAEGEWALLQVRDEGIGIEPEHLGRIFGKFERAVSERHYGGLGLGLYITRQVVEWLGGSVSAESRPGEGASFRVKLPLRGPPESP
ncbi:ATP-binding protein [Archangium gephyra]|uniref:sensor histidine kinase n=1 Tax=Archangium gephyra TaxID=48 RepID=UPI0035D4ECF9